MTTSPVKVTALIGKGYDSYWNCEKRYRVLKGGKGSKKSSVTALNLIYRLMKYPQSNLLVIRAVMNTHRNSTFALLCWAQKRLGVEKLWSNSATNMEMTYLPTKQKIIFRGTDDVLKLAGLNAPLSTLTQLINNVQETVGYDTELVAFIDSCMYAALMNSSEISKFITVSEFKQGDVNLTVKSLNGVALIPVVRERMKTAYTFNQGAEGGFTPDAAAKEIYMLVCAKDGAHLMKKTEKMRIFTPDQNPDADAFKFDYRIYYDVFVKKSGLDAVWAWLSPSVTISAQPQNKTVTQGSITGNISVTASAQGSTLTYQWYSCDENGGNGKKVAGATNASLAIPADLDAGKHYFYAVITVDGLAKVKSNIATVTVNG